MDKQPGIMINGNNGNGNNGTGGNGFDHDYMENYGANDVSISLDDAIEKDIAQSTTIDTQDISELVDVQREKLDKVRSNKNERINGRLTYKENRNQEIKQFYADLKLVPEGVTKKIYDIAEKVNIDLYARRLNSFESKLESDLNKAIKNMEDYKKITKGKAVYKPSMNNERVRVKEKDKGLDYKLSELNFERRNVGLEYANSVGIINKITGQIKSVDQDINTLLNSGNSKESIQSELLAKTSLKGDLEYAMRDMEVIRDGFKKELKEYSNEYKELKFDNNEYLTVIDMSEKTIAYIGNRIKMIDNFRNKNEKSKAICVQLDLLNNLMAQKEKLEDATGTYTNIVNTSVTSLQNSFDEPGTYRSYNDGIKNTYEAYNDKSSVSDEKEMNKILQELNITLPQ